MINYDLTKIKALLFDVDGVLSAETITMDAQGTPLRTVNIKDGYALQLAAKSGLHVGVITGASVEAIRVRFEGLGIHEVHLGCSDKVPVYEDLLRRLDLKPEEVLYMGDDIPDYPVMRLRLPLLSRRCRPRDTSRQPLCEPPARRLRLRKGRHRTGLARPGQMDDRCQGLRMVGRRGAHCTPCAASRPYTLLYI